MYLRQGGGFRGLKGGGGLRGFCGDQSLAMAAVAHFHTSPPSTQMRQMMQALVLAVAVTVLLPTATPIAGMADAAAATRWNMSPPPTPLPPPPTNGSELEVRALAAPVEVPPYFLGSGWETWNCFFDYPDVYTPSASPELLARLKMYTPALLRVGGITADWIAYNGTARGAGRASAAGQLRGFWPTADRNVSMEQFRTLSAFVGQAGFTFLFDLNELFGRNCNYNGTTHCVGVWDTSNVRSFLQYLHDHRELEPSLGFELGNELTRSNHINMSQNIADHLRLYALIQDIWSDRPAEQRPQLYGPATDVCDDTAREFMVQTRGKVHFTYHSYPGLNDPLMPQNLLNTTWLRTRIFSDDRHANSSQCVKYWREYAQGTQLVLSETNSALSGPMNTFANMFWYAVSASTYAANGVSGHGRWSFLGGNFSLFNHSAQGLEPVPDFYFAAGFKQYTGAQALNASLGDQSDTAPLVFAFSAKNSTASHPAVTLVFAHPTNAAYTLALPGGAQPARTEVFFTADSPYDQQIRVNGERFPPAPDHVPTAVPGHYVLPGQPLTLPPRSVGFVVLHDFSRA